MSLKDAITADMTAAMKAKDAERTSALRMVRAAILTREKDGGSDITDDDVLKILNSLVKQRKDSIDQFTKAGRNDLAEKEQSELVVIEAYLPQGATAEEMEKAVADAIASTGATTMREMGVVMKAAQANLAGKSADGKALSELVKSKLG
jgi:uncharacterized protein YqeY